MFYIKKIKRAHLRSKNQKVVRLGVGFIFSLQKYGKEWKYV